MNGDVAGAEPSSLPSSTSTLNEALSVSEPSWRKVTRPAAISAAVKLVAALPPTSSVPLTTFEAVNLTPVAPSSASLKPRSAAVNV